LNLARKGWWQMPGDFVELIESRKRVYTTNGVTATRVFLVRTQLMNVYLPALGTSYNASSSDPVDQALRLTRVTLIPEGAEVTINGVKDREYRRAECEYEIPDFTREISGNDLLQGVSVTRDLNLQVVEVTSGYKWQQDNEDVGKAVNIIIPTIDLTIRTWVRTSEFESTKHAAYLAVAGKVNNNTFYGYPAETVLYQAFSSENAFRQDVADWVTSVIHKFHVICLTSGSTVVTHNHLPRETNSGVVWQRVTPAIYASADFSSLLPSGE